MNEMYDAEAETLDDARIFFSTRSNGNLLCIFNGNMRLCLRYTDAVSFFKEHLK